MARKPIIIINGPNLNLLGTRQPEIYGTRSFDDYFKELEQIFENEILIYLQSNHEGLLIDWIQHYDHIGKGIVLNAAAYTHTSIAIADAISAVEIPVVEVHISDINNREEYRKKSFLKDVCVHEVSGLGLKSYEEAIRFIIDIH
jgi:3-dehydroquinate dehydratase II